jgi:uncharacterized protein (DUF302 family)
MSTREIRVQRFSAVSRKPFTVVVAAFENAIARPDLKAFREKMAAASTEAELEKVVGDSTSPAGLMEFTRFDLGDVLRKEPGGGAANSMRFVVGNPVIMKQLVKSVPDAGSYAPVTILIDERPDGVHLSYDRMASFLAPYQSSEALRVASDLDRKVEAILISASS